MKYIFLSNTFWVKNKNGKFQGKERKIWVRLLPPGEPHSWWKMILTWHCSTWLDMIAFDRSKLIVWERWRGFYPITLGKEQQTPLYQMPWWDQETAKNWSFPICEIIYCFSHYEAAHWSGVFLYKSKLIVARSQIIAKKDKKQPVKYFHYY